jgi:hypothetical protein
MYRIKPCIVCVIHGWWGWMKNLEAGESVDYIFIKRLYPLFDGYAIAIAIGGSLGNGRDELKKLLEFIMPLLKQGHRKTKLIHLLGITDPREYFECCAFRCGYDGFMLSHKTWPSSWNTFN